MPKTKMFDRYNERVIKPEKEVPFYPFVPKDRLMGSTNVRLLKNVKGEEIGVTVKENAGFSIYFTFEGYTEEGTLTDILNDGIFYFEILDHRHRKLLSAPVELYPDDCMAKVDLISEAEGPLKFGTYKMHLYMILDGLTYDLISPHDAVLQIE